MDYRFWNYERIIVLKLTGVNAENQNKKFKSFEYWVEINKVNSEGLPMSTLGDTTKFTCSMHDTYVCEFRIELYSGRARKSQNFDWLILKLSFLANLKFQNIFPLANSFAKWENVRRWQAPYGTRVRRISTFVGGACPRH